MTEQNKALVRRAVMEAHSDGNWEVVDEVYASDYVLHTPTPAPIEEVRGSEAIKRFIETQRAAFPGLEFTIEDQIAEGDKVVTRLTARGTQRGDLPGIPATGNEMCMTATVIHRIANGQLVEKWSDKDVLAMLQQLNVIPPLN